MSAKIDLRPYTGKIVRITVTRGYGDNMRTRVHTGVILDFNYAMVKMKSSYDLKTSSHAIEIKRPVEGRDTVTIIELEEKS